MRPNMLLKSQEALAIPPPQSLGRGFREERVFENHLKAVFLRLPGVEDQGFFLFFLSFCLSFF
jgi:hypothetical protein